ncbi:hypothetical protein [Vibrio aestuarianus]|nr:hypothetical protein [Vibrio aestuarianus]
MALKVNSIGYMANNFASFTANKKDEENVKKGDRSQVEKGLTTQKISQ